jgi:hypothetical protein
MVTFQLKVSALAVSHLLDEDEKVDDIAAQLFLFLPLPLYPQLKV